MMTRDELAKVLDDVRKRIALAVGSDVPNEARSAALAAARLAEKVLATLLEEIEEELGTAPPPPPPVHAPGCQGPTALDVPCGCGAYRPRTPRRASRGGRSHAETIASAVARGAGRGVERVVRDGIADLLGGRRRR
jgi:hypothetical protein